MKQFRDHSLVAAIGRCLAVLAMLVASPLPGLAAIQLGGNVNVSSSASGADSPSVAANKTGEFLLVWAENGAIQGQRLSADGEKLGSKFVIDSPNDGSSDDSPVVAFNPVNNQFLVVYRRGNNQTTFPALYARRLDASGGPVASETPIDANFPAYPQSLALSVNSKTGHYFLVWGADQLQVGGQVNAIYGVRLGLDGSPILFSTNVTLVSNISTGANPTLTYNSRHDEFLLVFESQGLVGNGKDLVGARFSAKDIDDQGNPITLSQSFLNAFAVYSGTDDQTQATALYDPDADRYAVIWKDLHGGGEAIYGNWIVDAAPTATEMQLVSRARAATLAYSPLPQPMFFLSWVSVDANSQFPLMGRYLVPGTTQLAKILGPIFRISSGSNVNTAAAPVFAVSADGAQGLSSWSNAAASPNVFAQLLDLTFRYTAMQQPAVTVVFPEKTVGNPLTYKIKIRNIGSFTAKDVLVTDVLPAGVDFTSAKFGNSGVCDQADGQVSCLLGDVAKGTTVVVTIEVTPQILGRITNSARVSWSNQSDSQTDLVTKTATRVNYPGALSLTSPNGSETLQSGALQPITWEIANGVAGIDLTFRVQYSLNNGASWLRPLTEPVAADTSGTDFKYSIDAATVPTPRSNRPKGRVRVLGFTTDGFRIGGDVSASPFRIEVVKVDSPIGGGLPLPTGESTTIAWTTNATAKPVAKTRLRYSLNKGASWKLIGDLDSNPGTYDWLVPALRANTTKALVQVTLLDDRGRALGTDRSDTPFGIDVVKLTAPNGGESYHGGDLVAIDWTTHGTVADVATVRLQYSLNKGRGWTTITTLTGNPGSYAWTTSSLAKSTSKALVRAVLLDERGRRLGVDQTDATFTILPQSP